MYWFKALSIDEILKISNIRAILQLGSNKEKVQTILLNPQQFRAMNSNTLYASLILILMCYQKLRLESMFTPRQFTPRPLIEYWLCNIVPCKS